MTDTGILVTLALALIAATVGGAVAVRLGQSPILGYVVGGLLISPYTAGPVADPATVGALADIGVVFLLFAIGLELSFGQLLRVGRVAVIGGTAQVIGLVVLGYFVGIALGFQPLESLFFGAFISQSSSAVMAKILSERAELGTVHGHVSLAWATLQDLSTIVLVVLLGALSLGGDLVADVGLALAKAAIFLAILVPLGLKVLPWLFERVAVLRSREVFILTVVAVALGTAYVSELFGLSLALGAFLAGMLISESEISHHVLGELSPVRDVFAALFFVSVGMFVDPRFVVASVGLILLAVLLIVPVKGAVVAGLSWIGGIPRRSAVLTGVLLAQAGEFSFLLARQGVEAGVVGDEMFSLMLASAALSIVVAPSAARAAPALLRNLDLRYGGRAHGGAAGADDGATGAARRHAVVCGYGRVGRLVGDALERRGVPYTVIEADPRTCRSLRARGVPVVQGLAENERNLARADLEHANVVIVALPETISLRLVVHFIRHAHPRLPIIARARTVAEREFLQDEGVAEIVVAETEVALEMARYTLGRLGVSAAETAAIVRGLRRRATGT
jgi:CPA2 family monovalent cation:H+ antiporter-2